MWNEGVDRSVYIGRGVVFNGSIHAPERVVINGHFEGELNAPTVIVSSQAVVHGVTTADTIKVQGTLNDVVICRDLLEIASTGSINGNVTYRVLDVEQGGKILGVVNSLV